MTNLRNAPSVSMWRSQVAMYAEFTNRVLYGVIHAPHRDYSAGIAKLVASPVFRRFCNEVHESLYATLNRYLACEDACVLERELFSSSGVLEEVPMDSEAAFRALTKLYTQYISAENLAVDPFKSDAHEYKALVHAATTLPTTTRVVERSAFDGAIQSVEEDSALIYETKFRPLNFLLGGGIRARRLYTVGGAPGVGKSIFLLNMFLDAALNKVPVVYLSLENSVEETQRRLIAYMAEYDLGQLYFEREGVRDEVLRRLEDVKDDIERLNEYGTIMEMGGASLNDLVAIMAEKKPRLFLPDYLNLIDHNVYGNKPKDLEDLTTQLARQSKLFDNAIVTVCQLNRDAVSAKSPDETTVGESWGIVKSSDLFATLYPHRVQSKDETNDHLPDDVDISKVMYLSIVKSRFTPPGKVTLHARKEIVKLEAL